METPQEEAAVMVHTMLQGMTYLGFCSDDAFDLIVQRLKDVKGINEEARALLIGLVREVELNGF